MPYQRAISTLGCAGLSVPAALALAARYGLDGLELRAAGGTIDIPGHLESTCGRPAEFARMVRGSGRRIVAFDTSLRLTGGDPAARADFLRFVPWAEALGVPWLRVFDGAAAHGTSGERDALATIDWWRGLRRQHGWNVDCIVETHDSLLNAAVITRFLAAAPGVKILWDTHHTWKLGGEDPVATWHAIGPQVAHLHVKDSVARPGGRDAFTYVPPGTGEFPMAPLAQILRREYSGVVSLEWERLWHPGLPALEVALDSIAATAWW